MDVVKFGSCGSVTNRSDALQAVRESAMGCSPTLIPLYTLVVVKERHIGVIYSVNCWRNTEIGVVVYGRIRTCCLCFTNRPVFTVSLVLERANEGGASDGSYIFKSFLQST